MGREQLPGVEIRKGRHGASIRISFYFRGVKCREALKLDPTPANLKYAARLRGEILIAIEKQTFRYGDYFPESARARVFGQGPSRVKLSELLKAWLVDCEKSAAKGNMSPSTIAGYRKIINGHLIPKWGTMAIPDLSPAALRTWITGLGTTAKTTRNILGPLRAVLGEALNDGMIEVNPLDRIDLSKLLAKHAIKSDYDVDPFDLAEMRTILETAEPETRNLFQFAFWSGLRTSELIALSWTDIDFKAGLIRIRRAVVVKTIKKPKTDAGNRDVLLLPSARSALEAQRPLTALGGGRIWRFQGHPLETDKQVREWLWRPLLKKAGVRYRNPYQTRHTYASMLLSRGENPLWVANQMGHVDTEMITRHYGKWIPDRAAKAGYATVNAWDEFGRNAADSEDGTAGEHG